MDFTDMTPRERAAFRAGIETMRQMALAAAITLEVRDDARELRQQAAVAALQGLAEGAAALFAKTPASTTSEIDCGFEPLISA
ncbi:hypothetical protein [Methylobacterium soli]|uniref:Uncharacterized protein n=1 Tax=Methylobacterium soli TaxID=553447 RepID=A0A6L3T4N6_9HYPH|nr:hypothetical protein [Methylobacterium soli]KAB1078226.1 hypothetical protein F6X53_15855 [Methylobacterium soli]